MERRLVHSCSFCLYVLDFVISLHLILNLLLPIFLDLIISISDSIINNNYEMKIKIEYEANNICSRISNYPKYNGSECKHNSSQEEWGTFLTSI